MTNVTVSAPIRLIFIDVDGTLVGHDLKITPEVRRVLEETRRRGVQIALCTGRPEIATRHYVEELGLEGYHVFDAGALIKDTLANKILYHKPLPRTIAEQVLAYSHEHDIYLEAYGAGGYFVERVLERSHLHAKLQNTPFTVTDFAKLIASTELTKMEAVTGSDAEAARVQVMLDKFSATGEIDYGWATAPGLDLLFVNVLAKGISKGDAVKRLIAHTGLPVAQVMGVGDGPNDEPLIRAVGVGVAMGDAPDMLKQHAAWITGSVQEDGLARAIERFVLNV